MVYSLRELEVIDDVFGRDFIESNTSGIDLVKRTLVLHPESTTPTFTTMEDDQQW